MSKSFKASSFKNFFRFYGFFTFFYFLLFLVTSVVLSVIYISTSNLFYIYFLIAFFALMAVLFIFYVVYLERLFDSVFMRGLFDITAENYQALSDSDADLKQYPHHSYQEFDQLNNSVDKIKSQFKKATLISNSVDYSHINLNFIDAKRRLIDYTSFETYLEEIVFSSQNFRNVIIELYYQLGDDVLTDIEINYLINLLVANFSDYKDVLYVLKEDHKSLYLYLPRIDSMSKIKEQLEICSRNASINKRTPKGIVNLMAHFAVVCYPYSNLDEMLTDLQFVKREDEVINIYLPSRITYLKENRILKNSMNLNFMTKMVAPLLKLNLGLENSKKNFKELQKAIREISSFFSVDYAGIISFDEINKSYYLSFQVTAKGLTPLSRQDSRVEKEFVMSMDQAKDLDNSYYFSRRSHANVALGRHLDRVGIESGFFYVLKDSDTVVGAIYFFNKNKPFHIDSYIQEAFTLLCDKIAMIILGDSRDREVEYSYQEMDAILKLTEYATYRVSNEHFVLLRNSNTMKTIFPHLQLGEKCYKTLYGLDAPCEDCPLFSGNKKVNKIGKNKYETSLILSEMGLTYHILTVKNIHQDDSQPRYHQDLIINSYQSLYESLENSFIVNGKGYLLLLRIDSMATLIEQKGSEGYLFIVRDFIKRIKHINNSLENIYYFNNQAIALLYSEYGQNDIFEVCESLFLLSRKDANSGIDYQLDITYFPISYPNVFPSASAVLKQAEQIFNKNKYNLHHNLIYADDGNYCRSADKDQYYLSVIESAFANKTFNVNLQPMVNAYDKHIFGAELLLRISDTLRNVVINTDDLVRVAGEHNKINIISRGLLDYVVSLYEQYGNSIFKLFGFNRLSINTDYSFFADDHFSIETKASIDKLRLPNDFLCFEINEKDAAEHREEYRSIVRELKSLHIVMAIDQYSGRYLSPEAIKNIGFSEVKISRYVVNNIDADRQRFLDLKQLIDDMKKLRLDVSVVGVENIDQYNLIKEISEDILIQGYYFYRPMEKSSLIETIREVNK